MTASISTSFQREYTVEPYECSLCLLEHAQCESVSHSFGARDAALQDRVHRFCLKQFRSLIRSKPLTLLTGRIECPLCRENLPLGERIIDDHASEKDRILFQIAFQQLSLDSLDMEARSDFDIVLAAVRQNAFALDFASDDLKANRMIVLEAIRSSTDEDEDRSPLEFASDDLRNDVDLVLVAVQYCPYAIEHASPAVKGNKEVVLAAVSKAGSLLSFASAALQDDEEVVRAAATTGVGLRYASLRLRQRHDIVLMFIRQCPWSFVDVDPLLKNNKAFVLDAIEECGPGVLEYVSQSLKDELTAMSH